MNKYDWGRLGCGCLLAGLTGMAAAQTLSDELASAIKDGQVKLNYRLRFEHVDDDAFADPASALTGRLLLGYGTADFYGFKTYVEMENVHAFGGQAYSSKPAPGNSRPVVADPEETEVHQAYLSFMGIPNSSLNLGRQRIVLDNARFIGDVGWRQNAQTFNALSFNSHLIPDVDFTYGYLSHTHRVDFQDIDTDANLFNVSYTALPIGKLTAYAYLLDFNEDDITPAQRAPYADTQSYGLRLNGSRAMASAKLLYTFEYAKQRAYHDASGIDEHYYLAEVGTEISGITVKLAQEMLGGNGHSAFQTPLATLHIFNGWADKFLTTPANGLVDNYLSAGTSLGGIQYLAMYHDFQADHDSADYGRELDVQASKKLTPYLTVLLKYANYHAEDYARNTKKYWVMSEINF